MNIQSIDKKIYSHYVFEALTDAKRICNEGHLEYITPELLLLCLMNQDIFGSVLSSINLDTEDLQHQLQEYIETYEQLDETLEEPDFSEHLCHMLSQLEGKVKTGKISDIKVADIVSEMHNLDDSFATCMLETIYDIDKQYVQKIYDNYQPEAPQSDWEKPKVKIQTQEITLSGEDIYNHMTSSMGRLMSALGGLGGQLLPPGMAAGAIGHAGAPQQKTPKSGDRKKKPWEHLVTCISDTYIHHNHLIGREEELERTMQVLCRKDKNNPLHIGESGVGKTSLIYGLADRIARGDVPEFLKDYTIYAMEMGTIVAGASYHGEQEKRIKMVMEGLREHGKCILYIDEIHSIMAGGNTANGGVDTANMLKPYLEDGSIRFIGSTTYQEYNKYMAGSKGIARRFQQIDILEPSTSQTIEIIKGLQPVYEKYHGVRYDDDTIQFAVEKSAQLIADRFLPDKAIDLIDEAGAYRKLHPLLNKAGAPKAARFQKVDCHLVSEILTKVCKINAKALTAANDDNTALRNLKANISSDIYGQDTAVEQVVRSVMMAKAGLTDSEKPLASLLFVGPTGVGKTEVCKVLARELGIDLVRFDMSEYTEKHTVAKLIGSPAGYVGYDDGGLLTDAIRKSPNCVLLLDEIEKAHSDIYNILLQVMDYARLTDNRGNKVDFKNVILIMTSNAGAQYAGQASIGFGGGQTKGEAMMQTVKKTFKPEFLNRLSGTVVFNDMDEHMASLILDKKLRLLQQKLDSKHVTLAVSPEAHAFLLKKGMTNQFGAREMDRVIQSNVIPLLMEEILFGYLRKGGNVTLACDNDKLTITS